MNISEYVLLSFKIFFIITIFQMLDFSSLFDTLGHLFNFLQISNTHY